MRTIDQTPVWLSADAASRRLERHRISGTHLRRSSRPSVEIVRHAEGPVEIKLSGLVDAAEQRVRRWRAIVVTMLIGLFLGAAGAVVILALRWDYERGRTLQLLRSDLEVSRLRERCWEALARRAPRSPEDIVPDSRRESWVGQCLATEMARLNAKR